MSRAMKIAHLAAAVFFTFCMSVQFNDPDAALWVGIYATAAAISAAAAIDKVIAPLAGVLAFGSLSGAVVLAQQVLGHQPLYGSEEGREMMGLGLVALWIGGIFWRELGRAARESAEAQDGDGA